VVPIIVYKSQKGDPGKNKIVTHFFHPVAFVRTKKTSELANVPGKTNLKSPTMEPNTPIDAVRAGTPLPTHDPALRPPDAANTQVCFNRK